MRLSAGCVALLLLPVVLLAQQSQSPAPKPQSDHEILLILHERAQRIQAAVDKVDSTVNNLEGTVAALQASQAEMTGRMETAFTIFIALLSVVAALLIAVLGWLGNHVHKHAQAIQKLNTLLDQREDIGARALKQSPK